MSLTTTKVHASACGRHFAALLSRCRLLVVYDFEKASNKEELYGQTLDIQISSPELQQSIYLAFDYGRISVVTVSKKCSLSTIIKGFFLKSMLDKRCLHHSSRRIQSANYFD